MKAPRWIIPAAWVTLPLAALALASCHSVASYETHAADAQSTADSRSDTAPLDTRIPPDPCRGGCDEGTTCVAGVCTPCTACSLGATQCCDEQNLCTCVADGQGCRHWAMSQECASQRCQNDACCETCQSLKYSCGETEDGCGNALNCGSCNDTGTTCVDGECTNCATCTVGEKKCCPDGESLCGCEENAARCTKWTVLKVCANDTCRDGACCHTCESLDAECGTQSDRCGGTLNCGECPSGSECVAGRCWECPECSQDETFCCDNGQAACECRETAPGCYQPAFVDWCNNNGSCTPGEAPCEI